MNKFLQSAPLVFLSIFIFFGLLVKPITDSFSLLNDNVLVEFDMGDTKESDKEDSEVKDLFNPKLAFTKTNYVQLYRFSNFNLNEKSINRISLKIISPPPEKL
jgi:hypothetical protein